VFDLVDEFDGETLAPNWHILLGSAEESGGVLRLHDPGVVAPLVGLPQEIGTVEGEVEFGNGDGNFTITSYWDPVPLPTNRQFFFQLYGIGSTVEAEGFTVNNLAAATAAAAGAPAGYSIGRERVFPLGGPPPVQDYVAIDPSAITGPIVLKMTEGSPFRRPSRRSRHSRSSRTPRSCSAPPRSPTPRPRVRASSRRRRSSRGSTRPAARSLPPGATSCSPREAPRPSTR